VDPDAPVREELKPVHQQSRRLCGRRRLGLDAAVAARTSDIYVATRGGWLYQAVILARYTRPVFGYRLSDRMPDERVLNARRHAGHTAGSTEGPSIRQR